MKTYYLYRHVRLDTNQPFYIGISTVNYSQPGQKCRYYRAHSLCNRNKKWQEIVATIEYDINILYECNNREEIEKKEEEFIALYGRIDLGTGTLVNETKGGTGLRGATKDVRKKIYQTALKTGGARRFLESRMKEVFVYSADGNFIFNYDSIKNCAKDIGCDKNEITIAIKERSVRFGYLFFYENKGDNIDTSEYKRPLDKSIPIVKLDKNNKILAIYKTMFDAANKNNCSPPTIKKRIDDGTEFGGYFWKKIPILNLKMKLNEVVFD